MSVVSHLPKTKLFCSVCMILPYRFFFSAADHLFKRHVIDFYDLKSDARNISHRTAHTASNPFHGDFVVLVNKIYSGNSGAKCCYLAAIFDKLDSYALPYSGIWLLCFYSHFLKNYSPCLRGTLQRIRFFVQMQFSTAKFPVAPSKRFVVLL